jgi:dihydroneopterin aldolase
MKDLKEAIEKLTDKVTSLEAELHVAKESLDNQKPVNYAAIEKWVNEEFAPEFKQKIEEALNEKLDNAEMMESISEMINDKVNESIETIAEGVQNWVCEEFAPEVQNWVCEEFAPEVQNWVVEEFAPEVQNWVVEEFAPEVQDWVVEEFAPEVQNWIVEEYSPEVQNWITEEYSPEVQNWITEEFAPVVDNWINEEFAPEHMQNVENKVNENVSAFLAENKAGRLEEIDSLLETIGSNGTPLENIVKESENESKWKGVYVVESMPAQYKPSWELLDEAHQEEIVRSSKLYDFTKAGVLESFWANVEFNKKEEKVNENLNPIQKYHNSIAEQMRRIGKW